MTYEVDDMIEITDLNEFPKSCALSYDKLYKIKTIYTCGSFEVVDDKGNMCWIDISRNEFITK